MAFLMDLLKENQGLIGLAHNCAIRAAHPHSGLILVLYPTCTRMDLGLCAQGNGRETYLEEWEGLWGKEVCPRGSELPGCPQEREQQLAALLPLAGPELN